MNLHRVGLSEFQMALYFARVTDSRVREFTSDPNELKGTGRFWLNDDETAGYGITWHGEFIALFNIGTPGKGKELVESAIRNGARLLDCFDGYLPTLYRSHGFVEFARVANWTPGGPDVVYMALPAFLPTAHKVA